MSTAARRRGERTDDARGRVTRLFHAVHGQPELHCRSYTAVPRGTRENLAMRYAVPGGGFQHSGNYPMVFQHSGARDFDLGGGFQHSGNYPMVFQHSGSERSRLIRSLANALSV